MDLNDLNPLRGRGDKDGKKPIVPTPPSMRNNALSILLIFLLLSGGWVWETRESDRTCDPCTVEFLDRRDTIQHK